MTTARVRTALATRRHRRSRAGRSRPVGRRARSRSTGGAAWPGARTRRGRRRRPSRAAGREPAGWSRSTQVRTSLPAIGRGVSHEWSAATPGHLGVVPLGQEGRPAGHGRRPSQSQCTNAPSRVMVTSVAPQPYTPQSQRAIGAVCGRAAATSRLTGTRTAYGSMPNPAPADVSSSPSTWAGTWNPSAPSTGAEAMSSRSAWVRPSCMPQRYRGTTTRSRASAAVTGHAPQSPTGSTRTDTTSPGANSSAVRTARLIGST